MKSVPKVVSTVLSTALIFMILISAAQWVAYENAEEKARSLPCNLSPAPYRLEVESFLPPEELLERGIGHRYGFSGELEMVVPEKLGEPNPEYEDMLWYLQDRLNVYVKFLREDIANATNERIRLTFELVERDYLALKFARQYGERNLTEVVLRPSPPITWVLEAKAKLKGFASLPEVRGMLTATFLAFAIFATFYLWLVCVAKIGTRAGRFRPLLSFLLLILIFTATGWGITWVAKVLPEESEGEHWAPWRNKECSESYGPDYSDIFRKKAMEYMDSHKEEVSCEVLEYLAHRLSREEMAELVKALSSNCT
ncbi:hypothetical protein [Thermococcus sp. JdF3]|uniref:hypothetical protein n=1 Tax=Thermococcus sp. JdF3 TaxID=1638258 RepID=UPI001438F68D|nr:hypothetical protein [Thermococcus sp. JdF3]NJE01336.1 hypothetical protein [Thermococcus sp. JdF3]